MNVFYTISDAVEFEISHRIADKTTWFARNDVNEGTCLKFTFIDNMFMSSGIFSRLYE